VDFCEEFGFRKMGGVVPMELVITSDYFAGDPAVAASTRSPQSQ